MSRKVLFRKYRAAVRASDFYYKDLMSRRYRRGGVDMGQMRYEHAALLLMSGHRDEAVEELETLLASSPESRFATYARAVVVVALAGKGQCPRATRMAAKLNLESIGGLGAMAGLAAGRCLLETKEWGRAVGWLSKVVSMSAKALLQGGGAQGHRRDAGLFVRAALGSAVGLARALSYGADPEAAVRQAMGLPKPLSVFVVAELQRVYKVRKMYAPVAVVCRVAAKFMAKEVAGGMKVLAEWRGLVDKSSGLEPVDLVAGGGRGPRGHRRRDMDGRRQDGGSRRGGPARSRRIGHRSHGQSRRQSHGRAQPRTASGR